MATRVAGETERLPWLVDDKPAKRGNGSGWLFAALSAVVLALVAAISFWFGMNQTPESPAVETAETASTATVELPSPADPAAREVEIAPMPQVQPVPQPQPVVLPRAEVVRPALEDAPPVRRMARRSAPVPHRRARSAGSTKAKAAPDKRKLQFTNPWESDGASGRMVRIGTYSSLQQGKQAWSRLARAFPGMKTLPAVVTDIPSLRNGKVYYRLQIGTTSQAHSEVLCQRMRAIGQSCVVLDVAGARKGNKDDGQPAGL